MTQNSYFKRKWFLSEIKSCKGIIFFLLNNNVLETNINVDVQASDNKGHVKKDNSFLERKKQ